uniref:Uncharacterized protein n=1 Tax=Salix viminalis TaxID=40686 RepID=A0A6N2LY31_SALVM
MGFVVTSFGPSAMIVSGKSRDKLQGHGSLGKMAWTILVPSRRLRDLELKQRSKTSFYLRPEIID